MSANLDANTSGNIDSLRMGEMAVVSGNGLLRSLLGSCVGLALFDTTKSVGGLVHIVLPDSPTRDLTTPDLTTLDSTANESPSIKSTRPTILPGKYVNTALPELIRRVCIIGGSRPSLVSKIAGGANMLNASSPITIGDRILTSLRNCLSDHQIPIVGEHCGGSRGRKMLFWPRDGKVKIELVGGESYEF